MKVKAALSSCPLSLMLLPCYPLRSILLSVPPKVEPWPAEKCQVGGYKWHCEDAMASTALHRARQARHSCSQAQSAARHGGCSCAPSGSLGCGRVLAWLSDGAQDRLAAAANSLLSDLASD